MAAHAFKVSHAHRATAAPEHAVIEGRVARARVPSNIHPATFAGYEWAGRPTEAQSALRDQVIDACSLPKDPVEAWRVLWDATTSRGGRDEDLGFGRRVAEIRFEMRITNTETSSEKYGNEFWVPVSKDGWCAGMSLDEPHHLRKPGMSICTGPLDGPLNELQVPGWVHPAVFADRYQSAESFRDGGGQKYGVTGMSDGEGEHLVKAAVERYGISEDVATAWGQIWNGSRNGGEFDNVASSMGIFFLDQVAPIVGDTRTVALRV